MAHRATRGHGGRRPWKQTPLDAIFIKRINELFDQTDWTQAELARRMSQFEDAPITVQTAFDSLKGQTQPTVGRVYTYMNVFAVSFEHLLGEDSVKPTLDEHIAYRWMQLTPEQKATAIYLIDSFVSANVNDGVGRVMKQFVTA